MKCCSASSALLRVVAQWEFVRCPMYFENSRLTSSMTSKSSWPSSNPSGTGKEGWPDQVLRLALSYSTVYPVAAVAALNNPFACAFHGRNIPCAGSGIGWPIAWTGQDCKKKRSSFRQCAGSCSWLLQWFSTSCYRRCSPQWVRTSAVAGNNCCCAWMKSISLRILLSLWKGW